MTIDFEYKIILILQSLGNESFSGVLVLWDRFVSLYAYVVVSLLFTLLWKRRIIFNLAFLFALTIAVSVSLKNMLGFTHPSTDIVRTLTGSTLTLSPYSFPSLTSALSVAFWIYLITSWRRVWFTIVGIFIILSTLFTKLYLGQHFPHDIVGGATIGFLMVMLFRFLEGRLSFLSSTEHTQRRVDNKMQPEKFPIVWNDEDERKYTWTRELIDERFPDPISPLFEDIYFGVLTRAVQKTTENFNLESSSYKPRYRTFDGYVYNNFDIKRTPKLKMVRFISNFRQLADKIDREYNAEVEDAHKKSLETVENYDVVHANVDVLCGYLEDVENRFDYCMTYQTMIAYLITTIEKLFSIIVNIIYGKSDPSVYAKLTSGFENEPIEMNRAAAKVANVAKIENLKELFEELSGKELLVKLKSDYANSDFMRNFSEFIDHYGFNATHYDFVNPIWKETPEIPLDMIRLQVITDFDMDVDDLLYIQKEVRQETVQQAEAIFKTSLFKMRLRGLFHKWLDLAQRYTVLKEQRLEIRLRFVAVLKEILLKIGERFTEAKALRNASEIFFLRRSEVTEGIEKLRKQEEVDFISAVTVRKTEFRKQFSLTPPESISIKGIVFSEAETEEEIRGIGASSGTAEGHGSIILSPADFSKFQKGDILIAKTTNPTWNPLFPLAGGIVTETGGRLCHASITAREFNIPAIVSAKGATKLRDRQVIRIDGDEGIIRVKVD